MPRALYFYHETLGIPIVSNLGEFVELGANEHCLLSLFARDAMRHSEPGISLDTVSGPQSVFALEVAQLDEYCASLRAKGVTFVSDAINHPEWGLRTAFLYDPDGNLLCLYSGIPA
jgi:catechol 2,3-dioxygenase-like lactoylglutathione lyase family enzyme